MLYVGRGLYPSPRSPAFPKFVFRRQGRYVTPFPYGKARRRFVEFLIIMRGAFMSSPVTVDAEIASQDRLEELIRRRVGNRVRDLRVRFAPDGLVLQGRAVSFHAKQVAQQAVMELARAPIRANEIEVA
jgi:hypothetical protein